MKYEAVFGDQSLFDGADEDVVLAETNGVYRTFHKESDKPYNVASVSRSDLAMRRIIAEPKRWTVEDKKAGRLPEVGCRVFDEMNEKEVIVKAINKRQVCLESPDGFIYLLPPNDIKPIETPEEKAARLREEWCKKAIGCAPISSEMQHYEMKRLGEYIGNIYDALLSGDLPVPVKDGE